MRYSSHESKRILDELRAKDQTLPEWKKLPWPGVRMMYEATAGANAIEAALKHVWEIEAFALAPSGLAARMFEPADEHILLDLAPHETVLVPEIVWLAMRRRALAVGRALEVAQYALSLAANRDAARIDALVILAEFEARTGKSVRDFPAAVAAARIEERETE